MKYSSRFWLYAPLAVLLILAGASMAYWWTLTSALDKKLEALNGHEAIPGITISYASKSISGFPFNIDIVFTGFAAKGAGAHGPFAWTSERFALHRLTYGRSQDIYEAAGNQHLSWTSGGGNRFAVTFLPGSLRASAIIGRDGLARFDLDAVAVGGTENNGAPFAAGRIQFHLRRDPGGRELDLMASGDNLKVGNGKSAPRINNVTLYSNLSQLPVIIPLLRGEKSWSDAAANWRAQGGRVVLQKVAVQPVNAISDAQTGVPTMFNPLY
jgi:hypothetical protein